MIVTDIFYARFIDLIRNNLGHRKNIIKLLQYLECFPELIDVSVGELNAAINAFARYRKAEIERYPELYPNAEDLTFLLGNNEMPSWDEIYEKFISPDFDTWLSEFNTIFSEIGTFQFPDMDIPELTPVTTFGTLFVSFYRTYTLVTRPHYRTQKSSITQRGFMFGSTIAEMLALLAINGIVTNLFYAEKIWILYHEDEGFSKTLSNRIATL